MGLKINTNVSAANTARQLRKSNSAMKKSLERLSSGLRINRAADDAAGLAIAEDFSAQVRGFRVAQRNVQDGISLVQTAEGAISEIANIMQRVRELAVQAANGTLSTDNRTDLGAEVTELVGSVGEILTRLDFNGIDPFAAAVTIQSGADNGDQTTLAGTGTAITTTTLSINALSLSSVANAGTAIASIDTGLTALNTRRAQLGAAQNRLEFTSSVLQIREENAMSSESAIRDADIARETSMFTRNQILVNAGTSMLAQSNLVPQTALQLLG